MTSRERLLAALANQEADRVPISTYEMVGYDMGSWYNSQPSYSALMRMIREKTDCMYMAGVPGGRFGKEQDITHERTREGESLFVRTTFHTARGDLSMYERTDDAVHTTWTLEHLLKDIGDIDTYLGIPWELPDLDMSPLAKLQRDLGDNGILLPSYADPICVAAGLFEMGEFLVNAITEPERITYLMDALQERHMAQLKAALKAGKEAGVNWSEVVFRICGPEYATPPYLAPEQFAKFVTPYVKEMSDAIHEYGGKVRLHCHGKIGRVLDEIMKMYPDGLDPIEPPPDGDITLAEVKKRIGDRVCLFGNIELKLLERGKADEVRQFVIDAMEQAKAGGGFVLMSTASPINTPISPKTEENYRVYIDTALEYGRY